MTDGDTLGAAELRPFSPTPPRPRRLRAPWPTVAATERQMIQAALVEQQGRVVDAARQLGLTRHAVGKNWRSTGWAADTKADARPGENSAANAGQAPVATNNQEFYLAPASSRTAGHLD